MWLLGVSWNRVLRRIFGRKRKEVTEGWIKLYNEDLHGTRPVVYIDIFIFIYPSTQQSNKELISTFL
jgi:hypothetical protein